MMAGDSLRDRSLMIESRQQAAMLISTTPAGCWPKSSGSALIHDQQSDHPIHSSVSGDDLCVLRRQLIARGQR
jgi:hypothetical protein